MYISFLKINNFRKFGENDNIIGFVKSHSESPQKDLVASSTTLVIGKNNSGKTTVTKALELLHSDSEKSRVMILIIIIQNRYLKKT
ncbi:AAA family ATPase [Citrobacter freundii]|uniref:AAA family ATPase n=1 Tax=Citrobacter freundii TaxID=546 RepID=UPI00388E8335